MELPPILGLQSVQNSPRIAEVYRVVEDWEAFGAFCKYWLPKTSEEERTYFCLFGRRKYASDPATMPWLRDQSQLKRGVARHEDLMNKVAQLEVPLGTYICKGRAVPQECIVLYLHANPRSLWRATAGGIKMLADVVVHNNKDCNVHQAMLSELQRSKSRTIVVEFDIDMGDEAKDMDKLRDKLSVVLTATAGKCDVLRTRGGMHVFVRPQELEGTSREKTWHRELQMLSDQHGDLMMSVPGCVQGGIVPRWLYLAEPYPGSGL